MRHFKLSESATVTADASLLDVMRSVESSHTGIAVVADPQSRVVGVLTDGNIRRALLGGAQVSDSCAPYVNTRPILANVSDSPQALLNLMRTRAISQIPVVDNLGVLLGICTMASLLERDVRDNIVLLMAGGRGSRLGSLTMNTPKPMLPVGGQPILERMVEHLINTGFGNFVLAVGYQAEQIRHHFGTGHDRNCRIQYLEDHPGSPTGTAGSLARLHSVGWNGTDPVLVVNADLISNFDPGRMLDAHIRNSNDITIGARDHYEQSAYGVLEVDPQGKLLGIQEKPLTHQLISGGIYVIGARVARLVPETGDTPMTSIIHRCVQSHLTVGVHVLDGSWIDIGTPESLADANHTWARSTPSPQQGRKKPWGL